MSLLILAVALASALISSCTGMPPQVCPPDQLTNRPATVLTAACQTQGCLLPDDFLKLDAEAQAVKVQDCHEADLKLLLQCNANHIELVKWINERTVNKK